MGVGTTLLAITEYVSLKAAARIDGPRSAISSQHYQRPCQTENRHCDKYHSGGWHVRQKIEHLPAPLRSRRRQNKNIAIASMFQESREKALVRSAQE
jgi:hypothetical protein